MGFYPKDIAIELQGAIEDVAREHIESHMKNAVHRCHCAVCGSELEVESVNIDGDFDLEVHVFPCSCNNSEDD